MGNFWTDPLKAYEDNKITKHELMSQEHYAHHMEFIQDRMKYSISNQAIERMTKMTGTLYVFSEEELKELLKK